MVVLDNINSGAVLGSDETGTGDYFTPIVSACVYIPPENIPLLSSRSYDSKKLSDRFIVDFYNEYRHLFIYRWNYISQQRFNKLSKQFNANQIKLFLHYSNIKTFFDNNPTITINRIIIDQFSTLSSIQSYEENILKISPQFNFHSIAQIEWMTHAESQVLSVGIASIVARYHLLKLMNKQKHMWNFSFPLGASSIVDNAGREFVAIHGINALSEVAKIGFRNTQRILSVQDE